MDNDANIREELFDLIEATCENQLTGPQVVRLEEIMREHPWARGAYLEAMHVQSLLERFDASRDDAAEPAEISSGGILNRAELKRELLRRPRSVSFTLAGLVVTAAIIALAMIAAPIYWKSKPSSTDLAAHQPEAWLSSTYEAEWDAPIGKALPAGKRVTLAGGMAEVTFRSGATAVIDAPVEIEVEGPNRIRVYCGKLTAHVPPEAVGFQVSTKSAVVTDLGTEFGVSVKDDDNSYVEVFTGRVQLAAAGEEASAGVILSAGQAARITGDGKTIKAIDPQLADTEKFDRQMPERMIVLSDPADGHFARVPGQAELQPGTSGAGNIKSNRIGSGGEFGGNKRIMAMYFFPLRPLAADRKLIRADLLFDLVGKQGPPTFNVDLYALPGRDSTSVPASDFYLGADDERFTKLAAAVLQPDSPLGPIHIKGPELSSYLASLYEPDGTPRVKYAVFRLNATSNPGNNFSGYAISMRENSESTVSKPHLVLHLEPTSQPKPANNSSPEVE